MSDRDRRGSGTSEHGATVGVGTRADDGSRGPDLAGVVVGSLVGLAGGCFLAQSVVGFVVVGPFGVRPVVLSAVTLAVAMLVGGVLFLRAGRRTLGVGHGGTGVGWSLLLVGTVAGNGGALLLGAGIIGGTAAFLVVEGRRA